MSILLYCVAAKSGLPQAGTGVAGLPVLCSECDNAVAFYSKGVSAEAWAGAPLRESARQFHRVLQRIFENKAIIPFRFPTLMENDEELAAHLRENLTSYSELLQRFHNSAQMEAVISYSDASRPSAAISSGTEYLRAKQERSEKLQSVVAQLQRLAGGIVGEWRDRSIQNTVRAFALLDRGSVPEFKDKLRAFAVPAGLTVRVTGPWPVTEFSNVNQG